MQSPDFRESNSINFRKLNSFYTFISSWVPLTNYFLKSISRYFDELMTYLFYNLDVLSFFALDTCSDTCHDVWENVCPPKLVDFSMEIGGNELLSVQHYHQSMLRRSDAPKRVTFVELVSQPERSQKKNCDSHFVFSSNSYEAET